MGDAPRRRRRVRHPAETGREPAPTGEAGPDLTPPPAEAEPVAPERGLRGLLGGGSSQVSTGAALRARDAARPTAADLAAAEADLLIVRRHWTPRD
jgi:hypothetical protein